MSTLRDASVLAVFLALVQITLYKSGALAS